MPAGVTNGRFGTALHDELRDVIVTGNGKILVAGYDTNGSRGVVFAYGVNGFERAATLDTPGTDRFESITIAPETGRTWLVARTNGATPGFPGLGSSDLVIGDLVDGAFQPAFRGFDTTFEHPRQLASAPGVLAVAGEEHRFTEEGERRTHPVLGWFAVDDSAIALQWRTTRRTVAVERYTTVDVSSQLAVVGGVIEDPAARAFVSARDRDAGFLWEQPLPDTSSIAAVRILPDGDVLWAGTSTDSLHGDTDLVLGRLDGTSGAPEWTITQGTEANETIVDMALESGRIYLAGIVEEVDRDALLLVLDEDGATIAEERWSGTGDDVPAAIAVDDCGTAVISGYTSGDLVGSPQGARDGLLLVSRLASEPHL